MPIDLSRCKTTFCSLFLCALLTGCISYQPRVLVPSLTLSADDIEVMNPQTGSAPGINFAIDTAINESDSLFNVEVLPGVRVRSVNPGSPASSAGIRAGDVILSVNGLETNHPDTLSTLAQQTQQETLFTFQIRRNTQVLETSITLRPVSNSAAALTELYRIDPLATRAGYRTELLSVSGNVPVAAARIVTIEADSPLSEAGLKIDDIIIAVNGAPVGSAQELINRVNTDFNLGDRVTLSVYADKQILEKQLTLWDPGRRISQVNLWPLMQYEAELNPQRTSFSLLDFWLFAVYRYDRSGGERQHSLFEIFNFSSDYGELIEEPQ